MLVLLQVPSRTLQEHPVESERNLLFGMSPGKDHPSVECCRPTFATTARPNPEIGGGTFDHVADSDLLVVDESRQAHSVSRDVAVVPGAARQRPPPSSTFLRPLHATLDFAVMIDRIS
jgi:hypothetical protein